MEPRGGTGRGRRSGAVEQDMGMEETTRCCGCGRGMIFVDHGGRWVMALVRMVMDRSKEYSLFTREVTKTEIEVGTCIDL